MSIFSQRTNSGESKENKAIELKIEMEGSLGRKLSTQKKKMRQIQKAKTTNKRKENINERN